IVDPDHVIIARRRDHRGDGAAGDAIGEALDIRPFRVEPRIADHPGTRRRHRPAPGDVVPPYLPHRRGIEEDLREGAAIDMHLLIALPVQRHVEQHGGEGRRNGGGGEKNATHRIQRLRV
ncbi:MAG: hypothetical protein ACK559_35130, partial [bacterium]